MKIRLNRFTVVLLLFLPCAILAQFKIDRIDDDYTSSIKVIEFWSRPHFNRVEGVFLHSGLFVRPVINSELTLAFNAGYGTKNRDVRYSASVRYRFFREDRTILHAGLFKETYSNDSWKIGRIENSFAGLLLREDFMDYFLRQGWYAFVDQMLWHQHIVRLEFANYRYGSMPVYSNFAGTFFGADKQFPINPEIISGREKSLRLYLSLDFRRTSYFETSGLSLNASVQKNWGDFPNLGVFTDWRYHLPVFENQKLSFQLLAGFRKGSAAPQHLMSIGGVGSLRAWPERFHKGQNLLYVKAAYDLGGGLLLKTPAKKIPTIDSAGLGVFYEMGDAWASEHPQSSLFSGLNHAGWLMDAGISVFFFDGIIRFDFARQLVDSPKSWRITMRIFNRF